MGWVYDIYGRSLDDCELNCYLDFDFDFDFDHDVRFTSHLFSPFPPPQKIKQKSKFLARVRREKKGAAVR